MDSVSKRLAGCAVVLAWVGACTPPQTRCRTDEDCQADKTCVDSVCVVTTRPDPSSSSSAFTPTSTGASSSSHPGTSAGPVSTSGDPSTSSHADSSSGPPSSSATSGPGSGSSGVQVSSSGPPAAEVEVRPALLTLLVNECFRFQAIPRGVSGPVQWTLGGPGASVDPTGLFCATGPGVWTLTATLDGGTASAQAAVTVVSPAFRSLVGRVAYNGLRQGRIHVVVMRQEGDDTSLAGTTLAAPGPFLVRGVQDTQTRRVFAYMDTLDIGRYVPCADPSGYTDVDLGTLPDGQEVVVTMTDPPAMGAPAAPVVAGMSLEEGVGVVMELPRTAGGEVAVDQVLVFWNANQDPDPRHAQGTRTLVAPQEPVLVGPLPPGQYYFYAQASCQGHVGPASAGVRLASQVPAGGVLVGGVVEVPGERSGAVLVVGIHSDQSGAAFITFIADPEAHQAYVLSNVTSGHYEAFAFLDRRGSSSWDMAPSIMDHGPLVSVDGTGPVEVRTMVLPDGVMAARVQAMGFRTANGPSWSLFHEVVPIRMHTARVTLVGGPGVTGPVDLGHQWKSHERAVLDVYLGSAPPLPAQTFTYEVLFEDGVAARTQATLPVFQDGFATPTFPAEGEVTTSNRPLFTWTLPANLPAAHSLRLEVRDSSGGNVWDATLAPQTTATQYNVDGRARFVSLPDGRYAWRVKVEDPGRNSTSVETSFHVQQ